MSRRCNEQPVGTAIVDNDGDVLFRSCAMDVTASGRRPSLGFILLVDDEELASEEFRD
jgi:hypothetical protein